MFTTDGADDWVTAMLSLTGEVKEAYFEAITSDLLRHKCKTFNLLRSTYLIDHLLAFPT